MQPSNSLCSGSVSTDGRHRKPAGSSSDGGNERRGYCSDEIESSNRSGCSTFMRAIFILDDNPTSQAFVCAAFVPRRDARDFLMRHIPLNKRGEKRFPELESIGDAPRCAHLLASFPACQIRDLCAGVSTNLAKKSLKPWLGAERLFVAAQNCR